MDRYTHADVCGGSEPQYTSGREDFILGPTLDEREGGQQLFSSLQRGNRKFLKQLRGDRCFFNILRGEQMFFNISFQFQDPPGGNK